MLFRSGEAWTASGAGREAGASGESAAVGGRSGSGPAGSGDEGALTVPMLAACRRRRAPAPASLAAAGQVEEVVEDTVDGRDGHRDVAGTRLQVDAGARDVRA